MIPKVDSTKLAIECGIIRGKSKKQRKDIPKTISNGAFVFKNVFICIYIKT